MYSTSGVNIKLLTNVRAKKIMMQINIILDQIVRGYKYIKTGMSVGQP